MKTRKQITMITLIDVGKKSDKIQYPFVIKNKIKTTLSKPKMEETSLNFIQGVYNKFIIKKKVYNKSPSIQKHSH